MKRAALLALLLLGACSTQTVPIVPPAPPPQPSPVDPVPPPSPVTVVVPAETAARVVEGMTFAEVRALIGFAPTNDAAQDDGRRIAEWPATNAANEPRWLSVTFGSDGKVVDGRPALLPRAVAAPEMPTPTGSLPDDEFDIEECVGEACRAPGR